MSAVDVPRRRRPQSRWPLPFSPWHLVLLPIALVMLTPLVWMLVTSIETVPETRRFPPVIIPSGIHWQFYQTALTEDTDGAVVREHDDRHRGVGDRQPRILQPRRLAFARLRFAGRNIAFS